MPQKLPPSIEGKSVVVYMPDFFRDSLVRIHIQTARGVMSWYRNVGVPDQYSDTVVHVNSDLMGGGYDQHWVPRYLWDQIVSVCRKHFRSDPSSPAISVRIINQYLD